jgi:hypothetical protein
VDVNPADILQNFFYFHVCLGVALLFGQSVNIAPP